MASRLKKSELAVGAGKYDELATQIREREDADGVILIVCGGVHNGGMAAQIDIELMHEVPKVLRTLAAEIEADLQRTDPAYPPPTAEQSGYARGADINPAASGLGGCATPTRRL